MSLKEMLLESLWLDDLLTALTHDQIELVLGGAGTKHVHILKWQTHAISLIAVFFKGSVGFVFL